METPCGKDLKKNDAAKKAEAAKRKAENNAERAANAADAKKTTSNESSESTLDTEAEKESKNVDRMPRKQVPRRVPAPATVPDVVDDEKTVEKLADENVKTDDVVTISSSLLARLDLADSPLMSIRLARPSRLLHAMRHQGRLLCLQHRTSADSVSYFNTRKSSRFRAKRCQMVCRFKSGMTATCAASLAYLPIQM
jgi:hypothetical protein